MKIEPIAFFHSPFTSKFGIPRQSGIVSELRGTIRFSPAFAHAEALRGLEHYDYLWLIWGFSENVDAVKHATVRPPLLGGNERMGVHRCHRPEDAEYRGVRCRPDGWHTDLRHQALSALCRQPS